MPETKRPITPDGHGMGYIPSPILPTDRIYELTPEHLLRAAASSDLRNTATTRVMDQDSVGCCVSCSSVGCFEWLQKAILGTYTSGSVLALYRWARDIDQISGDVGSTPGGNFDAMTNTGVAPNSAYPWPFVLENPSGVGYSANIANAEPSGAVKTAAAGFKVSSYARVNGADDLHTQTGVNRMRTTLSSPVTHTNPKTNATVTLPGLPLLIGLSVYIGYELFPEFGGGVDIAMPKPGDKVMGAHANVVVGYNDTHPNLDGSHGAFLVKNSWATSWGDGGYGWMPYNYILGGYAGADVWVVTMESELIPAGGGGGGGTGGTPVKYGDITAAGGCNINATVRVREFQPRVR